MTVSAIVETLAKELSVEREHAQNVFDLLNAGYKVPTIARFKRAQIGSFTDGTIRRFSRRLRQLEELEKRRATLLKSLEQQRKNDGEAGPSKSDGLIERMRKCMDRYELEDLSLPNRRPEPEVQLALDRGLDELATLLVAPADPASSSKARGANAPEPAAKGSNGTPEDAAPPAATAAEGATAEVPIAAEAASDAPDAAQAQPKSESDATAVADASEGAPESAPVATAEAAPEKGTDTTTSSPSLRAAIHGLHIEISPELARACAPFVNPDRDVHTDEQALEGAVRILSDRLGRNPSLRRSLRRTLRKHGQLTVRALAKEKDLGRHRPLLKLNKPLRQVQGNRLLALRQAQVDRMVAAQIAIDETKVLPSVRNALGDRIRPEFSSLADAVAEQALRQRLLPMIEDDVRNELRERAEEEAVRFIAQHLRHILLAPPVGARPVAGVHVDAKGDFLIQLVNRDGEPEGAEIKIEAGELSAAQLAEPLGAALRGSGTRALAIGHGKSFRTAVRKLREAIHLLGSDACVFLANDSGLASYANSEPARHELADHSVPARQAIGIARRLQDPLRELIKADVRHLGLGREQAVVSKANLRRVLHDTLESAVAHVGCNLNEAPISVLRHIPGLNFDLAKKLVERRTERPFSSREELRTEDLLDDQTWTNAIGFLRVPASPEPLDATALHPEQYDLVRRIILDAGGSVVETLGRRDALRGVHREPYDVDEYTWRDITREISHAGHDPRPRVFMPELLAPDVDAKTLEKGQVVEGMVSNVTSFGAFVDLGIAHDGMIHISEISSRYVRDARVLLSIGQIVRARVLDSSGPRVELSLKSVPPVRRKSSGGARSGARSGGGGRGKRSGEGKSESWPRYEPTVRGARSRRDGLVTGGSDREKRGRGGRGQGRPGGGRPGGGRAGGRRGSRDDQYDPAAVRDASKTRLANNPFAKFFKGSGSSATDDGDAKDD